MSIVIEAPFNKLLSRPCIVVSTISEEGVSNADPFSFNSPATTKPPMYGFCYEVEHARAIILNVIICVILFVVLCVCVNSVCGI